MAEDEIVKKRLQKADEDFGYAALSLDEEFQYFPQICWHFQQAAEKYLKAYIVAFDLEFRKIHDLIALLNTCSKKDPIFSSLIEDCKYLQKFYIETRYPVVWDARPTKQETLQTRSAADKIANFVKERIFK